jgi:hypothetical protein
MENKNVNEQFKKTSELITELHIELNLFKTKTEEKIKEAEEHLKAVLLKENFETFEYLAEYYDSPYEYEENFLFYFRPGCGWDKILKRLQNLEHTKKTGKIYFNHSTADNPDKANFIFGRFLKKLKFGEDYFVFNQSWEERGFLSEEPVELMDV